MALTKGPLLSLDASGSVAGTIVFSKWKGRNYVRQLVTPANPKTEKQVSVRAVMKFFSQAWASLGTTEQASWDELASAKQVAPFNSYMAKNLERWANFLGGSQAYPAAESDDASVVGVTTATGGVGQATLSTVITTANQGWYLLIYRSLTTGFTPSFSNLVKAVDGTGASPIITVDTPLVPGTYFWRVQSVSVEGVKGALNAQSTAVVT